MGCGGVVCFPTLSAVFSSDDSGDSAHAASEHWPAGGAAGGGCWGLPGHQLLPGVSGPCPQHAPPLLDHAHAAAGGQGQSHFHRVNQILQKYISRYATSAVGSSFTFTQS